MPKQSDQDILSEAKTRFTTVNDFESTTRNNFRYDRRFDAGDSINLYQWPEELYRPRMDEAKPCLTVNKTHQHVLQICNDALKNKPGVTIRPVGNGATYKAAEILESIVRHIEYASNATDAYDSATKDMVVGGIGWWRVTTDYESEDSFDQTLFIRRIPDSLSVYMDPDIREIDGSDAKYAFVFSSMDRAQFDKTYPKYANEVGNSPLGEEQQDEFNWLSETNGKHVRLAEYYRRVEKQDTLHQLPDGRTIKESDAKDVGMLDDLRRLATQSRDIIRHEVEWFLIAGDKIIDKNIWAGSTIPLVRIIGEQVTIDGIMDRRGHVRALTDSQRIYNVMNSAAVESVGVQTKVPWLVSAEAIEGHEVQWRSANKKNYAYLVWNSFDDVGQRDVPKPERTDPPSYPPAYQQGLIQAAEDMNAASGQQAASFGIESNERSGKAIGERERAASTATFHFVDHLSIGIRYTGRILLEMIPKIYDTQRVIKVLGEDGTQQTVQIDPSIAHAHHDATGLDAESFPEQEISLVLNPSVGTYLVQSTVGPNYGTRRQEAFNAISQILMQNESLSSVAGDLLFRCADFPLADEIAARLKNLVPPKALGVGPDPQIEQLQMQMAQQHQVMDAQNQEILQLRNKQLISEQQKQIDWYKAETDRLDTVAKIDQAALMPIVREMVSQVLGTPINPVIAQHQMEATAIETSANQMMKLGEAFDQAQNAVQPPQPPAQPPQ